MWPPRACSGPCHAPHPQSARSRAAHFCSGAQKGLALQLQAHKLLALHAPYTRSRVSGVVHDEKHPASSRRPSQSAI